MPDHLYRRSPKGVWYARAYVRGKECRESLQTTSLREARRRLKVWLKSIELARYPADRHTWKDAVTRFLTSDATFKARTIQRYVTSFRTLDKMLSHLMLDQIDKLVLADIARRPGVINATRLRDLTAVSTVLNAAESWGWIENVPRYNRKLIKERKFIPVLPTDDRLDRFVAGCHEYRFQNQHGTLGFLAATLRYTGMRLNEAVTLEWRQFDLRRCAIQLEDTKGNRPRSVALDERAIRTITSTPRHLKSDYVFWWGDGLPYPTASHTLSRVRKALGIKWRTHDMRHYYAVEYLRRGGSLYDLQHQLGHSTISTTEDYLKYLTPVEAQKAKEGRG